MTDPEQSTGNALNTHVVFFDVNGDGIITRAEIRQALVELGFSSLLSSVLAPLLSLALPSDVAEVVEVRHDDTGALDETGGFDADAFDDWWKRTDTDGSGGLTRWELLVGSHRLAGDPSSFVASVAELQLVYHLLAEDGSLSRPAIEGFLNGDLFRELIAARG
ncbi:MAG: hypothetical protein ACI8PZ_001184 [Myxococcota bacterium]|jgi:hypothetical protein